MNYLVAALLASEDPTVTHHWLLPETPEIIYGGLAAVIVISALVKFAGPTVKKGFVGRTVGVKLRYEDFHTVTRDRSIDHHTADAKEIRRIAGECLKRVPLDQRLRLLGVRVGSVVRRDAFAHARVSTATMAVQESLPLFDNGIAGQ